MQRILGCRDYILEVYNHLEYPDIINTCTVNKEFSKWCQDLQVKRLIFQKYVDFVIQKNKNNKYMTFRCLIKRGKNLDVINELIKRGVDPSVEDNYAIKMASRYGHLAIVERLLEDSRVDPSADDNYAIRWASEKGYLAIVERLLEDPRVDPSAEDNYAIRWASRYGHLAIVERLLKDPRVDSSMEDDSAIQPASKYEHFAIVERILNIMEKFLNQYNNFLQE